MCIFAARIWKQVTQTLGALCKAISGDWAVFKNSSVIIPLKGLTYSFESFHHHYIKLVDFGWFPYQKSTIYVVNCCDMLNLYSIHVSTRVLNTDQSPIVPSCRHWFAGLGPTLQVPWKGSLMPLPEHGLQRIRSRSAVVETSLIPLFFQQPHLVSSGHPDWQLIPRKIQAEP